MIIASQSDVVQEVVLQAAKEKIKRLKKSKNVRRIRSIYEWRWDSHEDMLSNF